MKFEFVGVAWCQIWKLHKAPGEIEPKAALPDVSATELAARAIEKMVHRDTQRIKKCLFL